MTAFSFKTFDSTGAAQAFLPEFSSAEISFEFSDVGALKLAYPKAGVNYSALGLNRVEVGCFIDGVEMEDGRFYLQSVPEDETDDSEVVTYTGPSLLDRTSGAIVYPPDGSTTVATDQTFSNVTAGTILRTLFLQNSNRGGIMSVFTWASFSNTTDSAGNAWANTLGSITYTVGVDYLSVIRNLVDNGMIEVRMVGRDLRVYNGGGLGSDRTVQAEPVVLRKGRDFMEAPTTSTNEQIASAALIQGDEALLKEYVDNSLVTAWGRIETFISQGGVNDSTTLSVLSAQELLRRSQIRKEKTRKIAVGASEFYPYISYRVSDYIYSDTGKGLERLRIRQLVITIDQDGILSASMVLNDKFLEAEIAIARKVNGILGGANASGSVAIPAGPDAGVDTIAPGQVTGVSWNSSAYQAGNGETYSQLTVTYNALTVNADGTAIDDLDYYQIQTKRNSVSTWYDNQTTSDGTTAYITTQPNVNVDVRVRAIDRTGNKGAWSTTATGVTASDTTAPPVPATPTVSPYLGQIRVFWSGLGSGGESMPGDFRYTEVHMSTTSNFTPSSSTLVDQLNASGYSIQTDLTYGTPYYFKLISVDRSGNRSAASAQASAAPETVTGLDIAALTIQTNNMGDLAVSTAKIADAAIINAKIADLAVDNAKIGNVSVGKLTAGILSADVTVSARIKTSDTGARVELNSAGLQAYNSSNTQTVNIASSDGSVLMTGRFRTAMTGIRVEMTNTTDRSTIALYGSNSAYDPAFINSPTDSNGSAMVGINSGNFNYAGVNSKHRLFMANDQGIILQTYNVADQTITGYGLYMGQASMNIRRVNASDDSTGGRLDLASGSWSIQRLASGIPKGGSINATITGAQFSVFTSTGDVASEIGLRNDAIIQTKGKTYNARQYSYGGAEWLLPGTTSSNTANDGAAGSVWTMSQTYGSSLNTTPAVAYSWSRIGVSANAVGHHLYANSATGFSVAIAANLTGNLSFVVFQLQN